jgi:putative hemolysin
MTGVDDIESFSYAEPDDPRLKRGVIRLIERLSGQPYLVWLYRDYQRRDAARESFWDAAVKRLELKLVYDETRLAAWPRTGPLVVVANHPFGVLDGVVMCHLVAKVRPDFRVLTNSVLYRADEIKPWLLPIDFAETKEALKTNLASRATAKAHLMAGGCLVIFPAGGVSTTPRIWDKVAVDAEWKTFAARMIVQAKAGVAPVFFAGQNSSLFQIASHFSLTLRLSLLFKEVHDRIGSEVRVKIGEVLPYEALAALTDRQALMQHLRQLTYALGEGVQSPPCSRLKRPRRAPRDMPSFEALAGAA